MPPDSQCGVIPHPLFAHVQALEQSMTLTKAQIVEALFAENIFKKTQSAKITDTLFELMKRSLQNGEDVPISGFGKLSVKKSMNAMEEIPRLGSRSRSHPGRGLLSSAPTFYGLQ